MENWDTARTSYYGDLLDTKEAYLNFMRYSHEQFRKERDREMRERRCNSYE